MIKWFVPKTADFEVKKPQNLNLKILVIQPVLKNSRK